MINGTADLPNDKMKAAPWLQELKMSQVKKSSSQGKFLILVSMFLCDLGITLFFFFSLNDTSLKYKLS